MGEPLVRERNESPRRGGSVGLGPCHMVSKLGILCVGSLRFILDLRLDDAKEV